jgi:hypothetical protein
MTESPTANSTGDILQRLSGGRGYMKISQREALANSIKDVINGAKATEKGLIDKVSTLEKRKEALKVDKKQLKRDIKALQSTILDLSS